MAGGGWAAFGPIWCPPSGLQPARRHPDYPRPTCDPSGAHEHPCGAHTSPVAPGCRSAPAAGGRRPSTPARSQSRRSGSMPAVSLPGPHTDQHHPIACGTPAAASWVRGGTVASHPPAPAGSLPPPHWFCHQMRPHSGPGTAPIGGRRWCDKQAHGSILVSLECPRPAGSDAHHPAARRLIPASAAAGL